MSTVTSMRANGVEPGGVGVGGMVAQVAAVDHPDAFSALTLVSARPVAPGPVDDDLPDHDAATMDAVFSRPMPDWTDRSAVAAFAADGAELLGNDPEQARATAARIWDRTPSSEPSVQQANQLGMVFARLDCARGGVSASASSRCRRLSCTAARTILPGRQRRGARRRDPRRAAARPRRHGHRPAGARPARSPPRCSLLTPPPDRPAAAGTLRLADLDAGNGRFRRRAMHPQPSDRPSRRGRP